MTQPISETDAAQHLIDYLDRVIRNGESFSIVRGGTPIAVLQPLSSAKPLPRGPKVSDLPAIFASLPRFSQEETEEFARHVEEGRAMMNQVEDINRWEP